MTRIGTASMNINDIVENALAVLNVIESRLGASKMNRVYVKTTMGAPIMVGLR